MDPQKYTTAKAEFEKMEVAGIVRRSNSPWSSALPMVPKPDGSWHPCGDFRQLNNATVPDKYPVPNICDFSNNVAGSQVFSTLNLVKGYYQVEMFPDDIPKTAASDIRPLPGHVEAVALRHGLRSRASAAWSSFCLSLGIEHITTTTYHPQSKSGWLSACIGG